MSGTCTQPEDPVWKVLGVDGWDWAGRGRGYWEHRTMKISLLFICGSPRHTFKLPPVLLILVLVCISVDAVEHKSVVFLSSCFSFSFCSSFKP